MNAEQLLAHYGRVAETPNAVTRLRKFVLNLAVRGKLAKQDSAEHLSTIVELPASGGRSRARRRAAEPGIDLTVPYPLPDSWKWRALGSVATYGLPDKVDANRELPSNTWVLDLEDIEKDTSRLIRRVTSQERPFNSSKTMFRHGDVLFGKLRPYLNKVIVADEDGVCTTEIVPIRGTGVTDPSYLAMVLRSPLIMERIEKLMYGMKMPRLGTEDAMRLPVPLAPLAEQHRIVAKVDELMALCDRLEAARAQREATRDRLTAASLARLNAPKASQDGRASNEPTCHADARFALKVLSALTTRPDQVRPLRQTILNLAVKGKLVPQQVDDEPAQRLLQAIATAKSARKQKTKDARIRDEPDPAPTSLPISLPTNWALQSFENLFLFIDYRGKTPPKTGAGIPLITAKNIRMGHLNREPREFISEQTYTAWMTRGFPAIGDLFFTTEAPLANVCLNNISEPFALAQRVICFHPYGPINTKFVMLALMSDDMQLLIDRHATGMTARGIKAAKLKPLPIPVPPLAEQHRIVAKVDELMTLCDQLEASLAHGENTRGRLLDALLHEALEPTEVALEAA